MKMWFEDLRIPVRRADGRIVFGRIEPVTEDNLEDTLEQLDLARPRSLGRTQPGQPQTG